MKKSSGGTRKYGRNKVKCEKYRKEHRREKHFGEFLTTTLLKYCKDPSITNGGKRIST